MIKTLDTAKVSTCGQMVGVMKENFIKISAMAGENLHLQMVQSTRVTLSQDEDMEKGSTVFRTEAVMKGNGKTANTMDMGGYHFVEALEIVVSRSHALASLRSSRSVFRWTDGRVYQGEWKGSQHHGRGVKLDYRGVVIHDGMWVNHEPVKVLRKPPPSSHECLPGEIVISSTPYDDKCSTLGGSVVQQPRLRRIVTPPTEQSPLHIPTSRPRQHVLDSNFDARPKQVCSYELHQGPHRTQEVFRFAPEAVQRKPAPKPEGYWAENVLGPPPMARKQVSQGEVQAITPFEDLSHISTLIRDQQRALEKYNANHRRQQQAKHAPYVEESDRSKVFR